MRDLKILVGCAVVAAIVVACLPTCQAPNDGPSTPAPKAAAVEVPPLVTQEQVEKAAAALGSLVGSLHVKSDDGRYVALSELGRAAGEFARALGPEPVAPLTDDELKDLCESFDRWDASGRSNAPALAGVAEPGAPASWGTWTRRLLTAMRDAEQIEREAKPRAGEQAPSKPDRVLSDLDRANAAVFERWRPRLKAMLDRVIPGPR